MLVMNEGAGNELCNVDECTETTPTTYRSVSEHVSDLGQVVTCEPIAPKYCVVPKPLPPTGGCYHFNCGKCGKILECYVNTGNVFIDSLVGSFISTTSPKFCAPGLSSGNQVRTPCGQQCDQTYGTRLFTGRDWPGCPRTEIGVDHCEGGAGNDGSKPAGLSNFASYTFCLTDGNLESLTCTLDKCDREFCECRTNVPIMA